MHGIRVRKSKLLDIGLFRSPGVGRFAVAIAIQPATKNNHASWLRMQLALKDAVRWRTGRAGFESLWV